MEFESFLTTGLGPDLKNKKCLCLRSGSCIQSENSCLPLYVHGTIAWVYLAMPVIIVHIWAQLLITAFFPWQPTQHLLGLWKLASSKETPLRTNLISPCCDQSVSCHQQWNLIIKFWWATETMAQAALCGRGQGSPEHPEQQCEGRYPHLALGFLFGNLWLLEGTVSPVHG